MMNDQVVRIVRDRFLHAVHLARAEAIYSQQFVTICPSSDQHGWSGYWSNGWFIFFDEDRSGLKESDKEGIINIVSGEASLVMIGNTENRIIISPYGRHLGGNQDLDICPNKINTSESHNV